MAFSSDDVPTLTGKTVLVTGANSGIGFEAARVLARKGAEVLLACRSPERARAAQRSILDEYPTAKLTLLELDLSNLASVRRCAEQVLAEQTQLHVLINNAGVMALPKRLTADGFEMQFGVNHLGHFALTGLLMPRLLATPEARVVTVSSVASEAGVMRWDDLDGTRQYWKWPAYCQSKLANLLFSFELARRFEAHGVGLRSVACHPGYAATNLQLVGPELEGSRVAHTLMRWGNALLAQSAASGALPTLYAATAPAAESGTFIGPSGFLHRAGPPEVVRAVRRAHDPAAMQRLWKISSERTGVAFAALD